MGVNLQATLPILLKKKRWTQQRLADATGITRNDINAFANGRLEAGGERLERIAAALEVSVLELGAPLAEADEAGVTLIDRLEALEERAEKERKRFDRLLRAASVRLAALEAAQELQAPQADHRRKGR